MPPATQQTSIQEIICDWPSLREQLLAQWSEITGTELDRAWPRRRAVAALVQNHYGIPAPMIESYLYNMERRLAVL